MTTCKHWEDRRLSRTTGSVEISTTDPQFTVTDVGFPIVGTLVDKMGISTGWTWGFVQADCVDYNPAGLPNNYYLLCQYDVDFGGAGGDSGGPVFIWNNGSTAELAGILWGGGDGLSTFSGYADARYELGYTPWQISGF